MITQLKNGDVITLMAYSDRHSKDAGFSWFVGVNEKGEVTSNHTNGASAQWVVEKAGRKSIRLSAASNRAWYLKLLKNGTVTVGERGKRGKFSKFIPGMPFDIIFCVDTLKLLGTSGLPSKLDTARNVDGILV
jgi:hypothetical protein